MDMLWFAKDHQVPVSEVAQVMGIDEAQVERAFKDFDRKQRTTAYLRMQPVMLTDE
jgi:NAD+ synthase